MADFASIGSTRYYLRCGTAGNFWKYVFLDILVAGAIFAILGMALISTIHWVTPQDGANLLNLTQFFNGLRSDPADYWWLFFMMFSTIIPTVLHLMLALVAAFTLYPQKLLNWIAKDLHQASLGDEKDNLQEAKRAHLSISLAFTFACFLPVFAIAQLMQRTDWLVNGIISGFELFAVSIGAI